MSRLDRWEFPENKGTMDAHANASLLKLWYRKLYDPLISDDDYIATEDPAEAATILTYVVHVLQQFTLPNVVANTKMNSSNLTLLAVWCTWFDSNHVNVHVRCPR